MQRFLILTLVLLAFTPVSAQETHDPQVIDFQFKQRNPPISRRIIGGYESDIYVSPRYSVVLQHQKPKMRRPIYHNGGESLFFFLNARRIIVHPDSRKKNVTVRRAGELYLVEDGALHGGALLVDDNWMADVKITVPGTASDQKLTGAERALVKGGQLKRARNASVDIFDLLRFAGTDKPYATITALSGQALVSDLLVVNSPSEWRGASAKDILWFIVSGTGKFSAGGLDYPLKPRTLVRVPRGFSGDLRVAPSKKGARIIILQVIVDTGGPPAAY